MLPYYQAKTRKVHFIRFSSTLNDSGNNVAGALSLIANMRECVYHMRVAAFSPLANSPPAVRPAANGPPAKSPPPAAIRPFLA